MVTRTDGRAYESEPAVNVNQCTSCGICAGACPTSTPFRRTGPLRAGIELPDRSMANLRDELVGGSGRAGIIVFACDTGDADQLEQVDLRVIRMPCVGMLPPSFVDFALARNFARGVMIAGCAEGDCHHRLGNEWTAERMARRRDPYLRQRVDARQLCLSWLPRGSLRRRQRALDEFRAALSEIDDE